ncbi:protein NRT1/ PTR FAMILY 1.2-like [Momordica charantia]|uniref:Protein NRT1/ PTR FAMILY 1.2-like n=1 Tax=Momordica charantia TaxID=3673 RepID=A0A6J1DHM6_MOMCH|nr:protein NRT1/ PTR FAMILY 1.2-like [Momordica charantia]
MEESATMQSSSVNTQQTNLEETTPSHDHAPKSTKGGLLTMPFIIANESFEKVASYGLLPNMILYLMKDYNLGFAKGNNVLFFWSAATNFMPLLGAFLADSYLGRFLTIGFGSIASFLGMALLWLTAMVPATKPPACDPLHPLTCRSPSAGQMTLLVAAFGLMSVGAGGVRPCTLAFGADQIDRREDPNNKRILERFFGWYYASASFSVLIALTGIVYIQDHLGWKIGFGVPASLMLFATVLFFAASPIYVKQRATKSLFSSFVQVAVAAFKNRKLPLPPPASDKWFYHKDSYLTQPSEKLRFLNKACVVKNAEEDILADGRASDPWSLCTVEQVEELKTLIKVIPIWSTGVMMSINVSQSSFPLLQAKSMDRRISSASSFQIPAGSFGTFVIITIVLWVILYDRAILPLASKIRGKPVHFGVKSRMGAGLLCSFLAMALSAVVENVRRRKAIQQGLLDDPNAVVDISALWLVPQHCLSGLAEALNAIGQTEFYYSEFPKTMSSVASSLFGLGMAVANLLASAILSAVDEVTSKGGKQSWVSKNINRAHFENYYWILAILSGVNILYFVVCSWAYGPCVDQRRTAMDDGKISSNEEELSMLEARVKEEEGKMVELQRPKELQV